MVVSGSKHPTESSTLHTQLPVGDVYNHKQPAQCSRSHTHTHNQHVQYSKIKHKKEKYSMEESAVQCSSVCAALYREKQKQAKRLTLPLNQEHDEDVNLNTHTHRHVFFPLLCIRWQGNQFSYYNLFRLHTWLDHFLCRKRPLAKYSFLPRSQDVTTKCYKNKRNILRFT